MAKQPGSDKTGSVESAAGSRKSLVFDAEERRLPAVPESGPSELRILRIATLLHITLDLERVLQLFREELTIDVPHDGLGYVNADVGVSLKFGTESRHTAEYDLIVERNSIGVLSISRSHAFDAQEIHDFEYLVCGLVQPLVNALQYRIALDSAHRDPLTGTLNRSAMEIYVAREINLARRQDAPLSLLLMDLDKFKAVNDRFGHIVGDGVLREVSRRLLNHIRESDLLFRIGGDEYVVLLSNTDQHGASVVVTRVLLAFRQPIVVEERRFAIAMSVGIAVLEPGDEPPVLLQRADQAMYLAKTAGGDRFQFASGDEAVAPR